MTRDRWLVTATPPTLNGDLHLGHLSGPYLAADVFSRHHRRRGESIGYLTGIDDHQSYTELQAIRSGKTAAQVADWYGDRIEEAWRSAGVALDLVARPRRSLHHRSFTRTIFRTLYDRGDITPRTSPLPYCCNCQRWAYEAYVAGCCPHCGEPSCGNACEVCGQPNDCANLHSPTCTVCGVPCELRECTRLYLSLERHRAVLETFWGRVRMNHHIRALCSQMSMGPLPDIAVSHPAGWGIDVPVDGFADQRIYVWFEMAPGYLAATQEWSETLGRGWRDRWCSPDCVVQFFGYDNAYFHAILFPAIMAAYDADITLPTAFVSNEFYRLAGQKFSTSRRHAIWLNEVLSTTPADQLRLYSCWNRPAVHQTSFTWEDFDAFVRTGMLARWRSWLVRASHRRILAATLADTVGPTAHNHVPSALMSRVRHLVQGVDESLGVDAFSTRAVVSLLDRLVDEAAEFGAGLDYLVGHPRLAGEFVAGVRGESSAMAGFAAGLLPLAPGLAQQIWGGLGLSGNVADVAWTDIIAGVSVPLAHGDLGETCTLALPTSRPETGTWQASEVGVAK